MALLCLAPRPTPLDLQDILKATLMTSLAEGCDCSLGKAKGRSSCGLGASPKAVSTCNLMENMMPPRARPEPGENSELLGNVPIILNLSRKSWVELNLP